MSSFLSLRQHVSGAMADFLKEERMSCIKTQESLVALVSALSSYHEEGRELFPEFFIFDDLDAVRRIVPNVECVQVGQAEKEAATIARALKECAPLAQGGWAIFIHRQRRGFAYGLVSAGRNMLSVSLADLLITHGDPSIPAILVRQVAPATVEVRGVSQSSLVISFGTAKQNNISPAEALAVLVKSIVRDVPEDIREHTQAFFDRVISPVLKMGHGTLVAVMPAKRKVLPPEFQDCIPLTVPLNSQERVRDLIRKSDPESNTRLQSAAALINGMLLSDGITLFASDGTVKAYRVFVKHPLTGC